VAKVEGVWILFCDGDGAVYTSGLAIIYRLEEMWAYSFSGFIAAASAIFVWCSGCLL
jgi:hypothetical protein